MARYRVLYFGVTLSLTVEADSPEEAEQVANENAELGDHVWEDSDGDTEIERWIEGVGWTPVWPEGEEEA